MVPRSLDVTPIECTFFRRSCVRISYMFCHPIAHRMQECTSVHSYVCVCVCVCMNVPHLRGIFLCAVFFKFELFSTLLFAHARFVCFNICGSFQIIISAVFSLNLIARNWHIISIRKLIICTFILKHFQFCQSASSDLSVISLYKQSGIQFIVVSSTY